MSVYSNSVEAGFLPNLPGFRAKPIRSGYKAKHFEIVNGQPIVRSNQLPMLDGYEFPDDSSVASIGNTTALRSTRKPTLNMTNITLTFQGYFEETPISTEPQARQVRQCNLYYFVDDGTLKVVEKPQLNSGVSQGTLVRRAVIPKPDGSTVTENDLRLGEEIQIYGRKIKLVDCNSSTRAYLQNVLKIQGMTEPETVPTDSYQEYRMSLQPGGDDSWGRFHSKRNDNKTFVEAILGHPADNRGREGFIRYGNKTLRFKCIWDNTATLYGDILEFTLVYYLCDDTMEIVSVPAPGHKEQVPAKLLKRSKLPKNFGRNTSLGERPTSSAFFHWSDIVIGMCLSVYGRELQVMDADNTTREFYKSFEFPLDPPIYIPKPVLVVHEREIPPPTGFGSEEDSMRSVSGSLQPGPAPAKKLGENKILSFFCSLLSGGIDDAERRFVLSYYVTDNTLKIVEPPVRNSGFNGGLFLSRREVRKESGELLTEKDIFVGMNLKILKHIFLLLDANDGALRWMEERGYPRSSFYHIMDKIRPSLLDDAVSGVLAEKFQALETVEGGAGNVTKDNMSKVFNEYGLRSNSDENLVSDHEMLTIYRANGNKLSTFSYSKLIDQLINPTDEFK